MRYAKVSTISNYNVPCDPPCVKNRNAPLLTRAIHLRFISAKTGDVTMHVIKYEAREVRLLLSNKKLAKMGRSKSNDSNVICNNKGLTLNGVW